MTKIIEINCCSQYKCFNRQGLNTGKCLQEEKAISYSDSIPSWCPLPDKKVKK